MNAKYKLELYLRDEGVPYTVQHHPKAYTAREVAAIEHISGDRLAKVVMVVADETLVMLVLPASERVYLPQVRTVLGANEVRLAEEWEFARHFPDCELGAMPPFGNLYDIPVYVDSTLAAEAEISFQAGTHTDTMSISYDDFARLVKPRVAAFSLEEVLAK
jgi:Ala-tRNA(Pro) deacylase